MRDFRLADVLQVELEQGVREVWRRSAEVVQEKFDDGEANGLVGLVVVIEALD